MADVLMLNAEAETRREARTASFMVEYWCCFRNTFNFNFDAALYFPKTNNLLSTNHNTTKRYGSSTRQGWGFRALDFASDRSSTLIMMCVIETDTRDWLMIHSFIRSTPLRRESTGQIPVRAQESTRKTSKKPPFYKLVRQFARDHVT